MHVKEREISKPRAERLSRSRGRGTTATPNEPGKPVPQIRQGLWYNLRLAWWELTGEFCSEQPYSPFLLLLGLEVLLIFSGAVFLYSNSSSYMLQRHLLWLALGFIMSTVIYLLPIRTIVQCIPFLAAAALLLNAMPHIPGLQLASDGSPRWISIGGYSFQVSESLRLMLVLYFARRFSIDLLWYKKSIPAVKQKYSDYYPRIFWRPIIYLSLAVLLITLQKDYSTSVLLLFAAGGMMVLVGSWPSVGIIFLLVGVVSVVSVLPGVSDFFLKQTFRYSRFEQWLAGSGEQINWVYDSLRGGSWFGVGLGQGRVKNLIPVKMTDFPLAAVGEETGLLGVALVLVLFLAFAIVGLYLARQNQQPFGRYATVGLTCLVFFQALTNFAVSCGLLPVTGQPLPFFSVGGSSVLANLLILALLNSLNRPSRNTRSPSVPRAPARRWSYARRGASRSSNSETPPQDIDYYKNPSANYRSRCRDDKP